MFEIELHQLSLHTDSIFNYFKQIAGKSLNELIQQTAKLGTTIKLDGDP